ncbi:unnamed protein product [Calypogeia fissa]
MVGALQHRTPQPWSPLYGVSMRQFLAAMCYMALATVPSFAQGKQEIAVPSYAYPCFTSGCTWDVFKNGSSIVVINPNSGPNFTNSIEKDNYTLLVDTVKQNSTVTTVLGYVSTQRGSRDPSLVLGDIDMYYQAFTTKIDGIFLDEGNVTCDLTALYKSYDDRVKAHWGRTSGFTALNWGDPGPECYLTTTSINTYCTFEGNYSTYTSPLYTPNPDWVSNYNSSTFWHIVYTTPDDAGLVTAGVNLSKTRNAGNIYFTDAVYHTPADNPYNVSPSAIVWQTEVVAAHQGS